MAEALRVLVRIIAPVLSFTAEEIWERIPAGVKEEESVLLSKWVEFNESHKNEELATKWKKIAEIRKEVNRKLEEARQTGLIGHSLDARVKLNITNDEYKFIFDKEANEIADIFIVSQVERVSEEANNSEIEGISIYIEKADGEKCERCWKYDTKVGQDPIHTDVCPRCAAVLKEIG